jgi:LmbE family N-acetylglucosaminyl deacetylase
MEPAGINRRGTHLFISPHLDDAALSCGARILELADRSINVTVLTIFAGDPPSQHISPLASWFHTICGLGNDPVGTRRAEDLRAMAILGAHPIHVALPDCLYRVDAPGIPFIQEVGQIFTGDHRADRKLISQIASGLADLATHTTLFTIYVPLGIGRHIDHMIVRTGVEHFMERSRLDRKPTLVYYEDMPYASREADPTWRYELAIGLHPRVHQISAVHWARKMDAIRAYRSQASVLRGANEDLEDELWRYALHSGNGELSERFWTYRDDGPLGRSPTRSMVSNR